MKICMVLDHPFPPDIRVEKEARSLIRYGYKVHLLCVGEKNETEIIDNIHIHRFFLDKSSIIKKIQNARFLFNFFYINKWYEELIKLHQKENISTFHAHDLTTATYTLLAGKRANIPVILDMHENYPEALKTYMAKYKNGLSGLIFIYISLWRLTERICIKKASHIITVVRERKKRLINQGFNESKISVLPNTVDIRFISRIPIDQKITDRYTGRFIVTYVGGVGPHRGVDTLISAIPELSKHIRNLLILIVGGSISENSTLGKLCQTLDVYENLESVSWVDFSEVPSYISLSDICVVPHHKSGHTDTTVPHKLFQYMYFEKPVIVTDCLPLKRIVEECECGIVVGSGDHEAMAKAVLTMYGDNKIAEEYGKNGKKAVIEKYNWNKNAQVFLKIYKRSHAREF